MHASLLHLGPLTLPVYGVLAASGLLGALALSQRTAARAGVDAEALWDAGVFAVLCAYGVSRLLFALAHLKALRVAPWLLLAVPSLTPAGVLLTAAATLLWLRRRGVPWRGALDAWAPCTALVCTALAAGEAWDGSLVARGACAVAAVMTAGSYAWLGRTQRRGEAAGAVLVLAGVAASGYALLHSSGQPLRLGLDPMQWMGIGAVAAGGALVAFAGERGGRADGLPGTDNRHSS